MSRHTDLIDAVNDAKTQREHDYAQAFLDGWRDGAGTWSGLYADMHTMARLGMYRPMCCGVLLDWQPEQTP